MKILFFSEKFPPYAYGGSINIVYRLARRMNELGNDVYVVTSVQEKALEGLIRSENISIYRIYSNFHSRWRFWLNLYNPQTILKIRKIIKKIRPDIVHAHNIHYHLSYKCLEVAKKYAKAVFLTSHDVMLIHYGKLMPRDGNIYYSVSIKDRIKEAKKRYNPFRNYFIHHYLKSVDKIFAVSNSLKRLLKINRINNVETIYNGIDVEEWKIDSEEIEIFKEKYNLRNKKIIFFGGRLSPAKGGKVALQAMKIISKEITNVILLVAGEKNWYIEAMNLLIKKLGISDRVVFTGFLGIKQLSAAYHSADVCVSPSLCFESFGMTNIEAMACKKPVVSSYFGGPTEVVIDNVSGYLINPCNVDLIAEKVTELLKNHQKAEQFGEAGYKRVSESFSLEKQIQETLKWYKKYV